jgi:hypothetical protein
MASLMDDAFIDRCIEEYKNGESLRSICKCTGVNRAILTNIVVYNGIGIRGGKSTPNVGKGTISEYIHMYNRGMSTIDIEKNYGISREFLSYVLRKEGIAIRIDGRLYTDNPTAFSAIDDEMSAYVLGFFYADASIESNGKRHNVDITLAYRDYDHLCRIRDWISPDRVVKKRNAICNGKNYPACRLIVCSKTIVDNLIVLGCTPKKSPTLMFPTEKQVPKNLLRHFMRGYLDGDGSVGNYKQPSVVLDGTMDFLTKYFGVLSEYGVTMPKVTKPSGCYHVSKGGRNQLRIIHRFLYEDSHIHLERKKVIFDEIVNDCPLTK